MKLLSPSLEAAASYLGVSVSEASALLRRRRLTELREREAQQRRGANPTSLSRSRAKRP
jgi:hypothetical protein